VNFGFLGRKLTTNEQVPKRLGTNKLFEGSGIIATNDLSSKENKESR
jgi:hypothetical protein